MSRTAERITPAELIGRPQEMIDIYWKNIDQGMSDSFAMMLALQAPPVLNGDLDQTADREIKEEWEGMSDYRRKLHLRTAKAVGINTAGKFYHPKMGPPNEPTSWINGAEDMKRSAKETGSSLSGAINYTPPPKDPVKPEVLDDDVDTVARMKIQADPELTEKVSRGEVPIKSVLDEAREELKSS